MLGKRLVTPTRSRRSELAREKPADSFYTRPAAAMSALRKTGEKYGPEREAAAEQKEPRRSRYRAKVLHV